MARRCTECKKLILSYEGKEDFHLCPPLWIVTDLDDGFWKAVHADTAEDAAKAFCLEFCGEENKDDWAVLVEKEDVGGVSFRVRVEMEPCAYIEEKREL